MTKYRVTRKGRLFVEPETGKTVFEKEDIHGFDVPADVEAQLLADADKLDGYAARIAFIGSDGNTYTIESIPRGLTRTEEDQLSAIADYYSEEGTK